MAISVKADSVMLPPPSTATGTPLAVIWVEGMQCKPEAYITVAEELQRVAETQGYKMWIGIPEFLFDAPEPVIITPFVESAISELKSKYHFPGDNYYLAAHSLGGVIAQMFAKGRTDVKGMILTGSVMLQGTRNITDDGSTLFKYDIPTLTLNGEIDGLLRISRGAEAYWHGEVNVHESQKGMFPVMALEGLSHVSFMDYRYVPSAVLKDDICPATEEVVAHGRVAKAMMAFIGKIEGDTKAATLADDLVKWSETFLATMVEAMVLEGSYALKDPCYNVTLVNQNMSTCLRGAPWSEQAQKIMGGDISDKNADITTEDNFHRVYTVTPVHLPQINNSCPSDGNDACMLESITVTENYYNRLTEFDTGKQEIGAVEMKAKLMSRQSVQVHAGDKSSDFHKDDEEGSRCADINQKALDWALSKATPAAIARYNKYGKKLVIGDDLGPFNAGPLWIWQYLQYTDNDDKTQTVIQSPMMRTPTDYWIGDAAGFHYCKLLSPFRALEWIYVDSQHDHNKLPPPEGAHSEAAFLQ